MQNLRLGVAGAGYWGPNLIRNCAELGILDSVCDLDESALAAVARLYPGVATTTRFEELLARQVQGVVIATPAHLHASMCLEAIAAGKHVFVEKPLALTVSEGEQIARAAAQAGLVVFVGHVLLYHPAVRKLRALLAEDVIGPVWHLRSRRLSLGKLRNHESVWWSFAPHDIALMLAIMGEEPRSVLSAQTASMIAEISDVAYADFQFSNNRSAHIEVCWLDPEKSARLDVFGAHGVITLKDARGWQLPHGQPLRRFHRRARPSLGGTRRTTRDPGRRRRTTERRDVGVCRRHKYGEAAPNFGSTRCSSPASSVDGRCSSRALG